MTKYPTVTRFPRHAVMFDTAHFTIEHPVTCDLEACDLYERASAEWVEQPLVDGRYVTHRWLGLADDLALSEEVEARHTYMLVPAPPNEKVVVIVSQGGEWPEPPASLSYLVDVVRDPMGARRLYRAVLDAVAEREGSEG